MIKDARISCVRLAHLPTKSFHTVIFLPAGCNVPPTVDKADTDWVYGTWLIGDQVNATCHPGHLVEYNVDHQLVNCTNRGWASLPCHAGTVLGAHFVWPVGGKIL